MSSVIDKDTVKALREARGWSQSDLSRYSTVDKSVISRIERGMQQDYRISVLMNLATCFNVPIEMLVQTDRRQNSIQTIPELEDAIIQLKRHNSHVQKQVAAIIHAFLNTIERDE